MMRRLLTIQVFDALLVVGFASVSSLAVYGVLALVLR